MLKLLMESLSLRTSILITLGNAQSTQMDGLSFKSLPPRDGKSPTPGHKAEGGTGLQPPDPSLLVYAENRNLFS